MNLGRSLSGYDYTNLIDGTGYDDYDKAIMNDKLGRDPVLLKIISPNLSGGTEEDHQGTETGWVIHSSYRRYNSGWISEEVTGVSRPCEINYRRYNPCWISEEAAGESRPCEITYRRYNPCWISEEAAGVTAL
jgi:hypothetical protein